MLLLIIGLILWIGAHIYKRAFPEHRAALAERVGTRVKAVFAAAILLSVVLIVLGYRAAPFIPVYDPPAWGYAVNNALMYFAVLLFGLGSSKSPLRAKMRHPQLWGFTLWSALHLLVNGDLASVVMWGVFILWALAEMRLINAREPDYVPYQGGTKAGTVRLAIIALVLYFIIAAVHIWLGVNPFAGVAT